MPSLRPLLLTISALVAGCASASGSFAPLGSNHPASPQAPEIPITDPAALLRSDGSGAAEARPPSTAEGGVPSPGAFVCPMHAEVSSDQPGHCPKCGMTLVPRGNAEPVDGGHPHER